MLDTDICIYIINKRTESVLRQLQEKKGDGLFISTITLSELEFGIENSGYKEKNRMALLGFLAIMGIKRFDENAAREYGIVKKDLKDKGCLIGPMDMLIGAHAKSQNMTLVTNNADEFSRIKELAVENWA
ncbi:MAG: type II toxin-antitoxin system VapC family toxin [Treponema sp.]|nr:type II toxin-antitoxin system VapC family toxin [Treponema sp.]